MAKKNHIVKRYGISEAYDERKLYASVFSACMTVRMHDGEAELVAERVCQDVGKWLANKSEVTSLDIRNHAAKHLSAYNTEAGWMYKHHRAHIE